MTDQESKRGFCVVVAGGVLVLVIVFCGGFGYLGYRSLHTIVETFDLAIQPTIDGVSVGVEVRPQRRTEDGFGDRLVGPPYELMFLLRDPGDRMTRARLHSVQITPTGGNAFFAPVTNGDIPVRETGFVMLYSRVERESLGAHPRLVADIEVFTPDGSAREELTFSLRRGSRSSLNIP